MKQDRIALVLCDITKKHKNLKLIETFVKKFVGKNNVDMLVVYAGRGDVEEYFKKAFLEYEVPMAITDTYEWGENTSFVLVVTDDTKSVIESVAREHFVGKTFAVITMMLCKND